MESLMKKFVSEFKDFISRGELLFCQKEGSSQTIVKNLKGA